MFSDTRTGLVLMLAHAWTLSAVLLLLVTHVALGARIRRAIGAVGRAEASWRWPVDATLGAGALGLGLLALSSVGLASPAAVIATALVAAVVSGREWIAAMREALTLLRCARVRGESSALTERLAPYAHAALAVLATLLVAGALAPPTEWDSLMYHLRIPLWLLETGRLAVPPDSFHVALVGGSHFATLPLLAAGLRSGPALMQVGALVLTVMGTSAMAREVRLARTSGWLAAAMLLGSPAFALVAITARVDVTLVLALVAAQLAILAAADVSTAAIPESGQGEDTTAARLVLLAALLVAVAMGIKPQAGAYAIALIPHGWRAARGWRAALFAAAGAAVASAPWYIKNQLLVGSPLYPKGAPGWFEPWLAEIFEGRVRPGTVDASILRALPEARASFDLLAAFLAPETLTIEGEGAFYALSPLLLALPLLFLVFRRQSRASGLAFVALEYTALVVVPFGRINLRYLMPAVPALAVAVAAALEGASDLMATRMSVGMRRALWALCLVTAVLPLAGALRQRFFSGHVVLLRHAVGMASAQEVWRRHPDGTARGLAPVIANVQRLVPADGKVLLLWEARALPFEREALVDVMLSNWTYLAQSPAYGNCLAGTGITHVLVGAGSVEYYVDRGADPRSFMLDRFASFRERCFKAHASVGPGVELFTVR